MANTLFNYLYRDAANYKTHNQAIVAGTITEEQQKTIIESLDSGEYFIPSAVGLPEHRNFAFDPTIDHDLFELEKESFVATDAAPTVDLSAAQLVANFQSAKHSWLMP